jgi:hypothetical protein
MKRVDAQVEIDDVFVKISNNAIMFLFLSCLTSFRKLSGERIFLRLFKGLFATATKTLLVI